MSVETPQQTVLPKISKDVDFLSADDAVKVANLFNHGNVLTKSETLKEVKSVVPVKDGNARDKLDNQSQQYRFCKKV
ncbi:MAG: hypothetical protein IJ402_00185 [Bacteroidales bacterium]|nr:hypothetical protein [Bacteroidales bacterium]